VAVWETTVYVTCQKNNSIWIFNGNNGELITRFYSPGIGIEKIAVRDEKLWITDNLEQTVYCLVRGTGELIFSVLTPFSSPTGIAFYPDPDTQQDILYIAYSLEEPYIRDNPNSDPSHEIQYRDRAFVHPLYFHYDPERRFALSNGYALEMSYVEEIYPLEVPSLPNLEWRIAMPAETERQKIRSIEAIGLPFTEEIEEGQRVAVFKFDLLKATDRYIFGWKAIIDVWSIKYQILPEQCENLPLLSPQEQELYLVDDDELSMDTESVRRAAEEAIARETNILRKVYSIRNYVYDKLSYAIKPYIDTPDIVLTRGTGSCGEYLGLLLALCRLNGIACRTVGRYKCPGDPLQKGIPLQPDFNHVWMEFYLPSIGWLPMESNPDDIIEGGPYPNRFFMGLSWYHAEMGKGIPFETLSKTVLTEGIELPSIGELALNHVTFTILEELQP
jgi:transglutaminase-like putative cysteine protease